MQCLVLCPGVWHVEGLSQGSNTHLLGVQRKEEAFLALDFLGIVGLGKSLEVVSLLILREEENNKEPQQDLEFFLVLQSAVVIKRLHWEFVANMNDWCYKYKYIYIYRD